MYFCADSAAVGAALRAAHGWLCEDRREFVPFAQVVKCGSTDSALKLTLIAKGGDGENRGFYEQAVQERMALEGQMLEELGKV